MQQNISMIVSRFLSLHHRALDIFATEKLVNRGDGHGLEIPMSFHFYDVRCKEVFAMKSLLHRGFVMRVSPSFHLFLRKVSVVERCPL